MRNNTLLFINLISALLITSSCTSVKQELGVARNSPDEFTVIKRAPLTIPPEYNLVPPLDANDPKAIAHQENSMKSPTDKAKEAMFGTSSTKNLKADKSDGNFLAKLKADNTNPDIRRVIEEDNGYIALNNMSLVERLTSSDEEVAAQDKVPESVVDAKAEDKRIKENQKANKPITSGEVPVIEKKKSTLDKIF